MRIYIIGNAGITLCRELPATVDDGEIAVASNHELHAAALSGKRLLALWNALPGVEKRRKVGDREGLIDQLWSAIEALPDPEPEADAKRPSKHAAQFDGDVRARGQFRHAGPPCGVDFVLFAGIGAVAKHAADVAHNDRHLRHRARQRDH